MPKAAIKIALTLIWTGGVLFLVQILLSLPFRAIYQNSSLSSAAVQTAYSSLSFFIAFCIIVLVPWKLQAKSMVRQKTQKLSKNNTASHSAKLKVRQLRDQLGLIAWPTWTDLALAPIGFAVYVVLAGMLTNLFNLFPWFNATESQQLGYNAILLGGDRTLAFFALVIVAPITEELIFRGYLYNSIKSTILGARKNRQHHTPKNTKKTQLFAIIISTLLVSLLFGLMHRQWNVGVNVFAMSIILCLLREVTGTTYAGIILHIIKNLIAFYLIFILQSGF